MFAMTYILNIGFHQLYIFLKNSLKNCTFLFQGPDYEEEEIEDYVLKSVNLKQLIRKLHINQPAYHVMCLVGKKYAL